MENEIEINDNLITRYLVGEATPEEAIALDTWLQEPANKLHFKEIKNSWNMTYPSRVPRKINLSDAWRTFDNRKDNFGLPKKDSSVFIKNAIKIAASVILVTGFAYAIYYSSRPDKAVVIIAETKDSVRQIRFSDNSVAMLNRNSTITYPEEFEDDRHVLLSNGEAFFNVKSDLKRPFIIGTDVATIRVLGTSFNVIVRRNSMEVGVEQGSVLVYTLSDSVQLVAGMSTTVLRGNSSIAVGESNSNVWAYATQRFTFNDTPLADVFSYIEKARDCTIKVVDPSVENCKLSATFEDLSTDNMLNLITDALNLSVIKNDDRTFTVEGQGCR